MLPNFALHIPSVVSCAAADNEKLASFAKAHRPRGVSIELREPTKTMDAAAVARLAAAGVTDAADPSWQQQQADLLQPSALFDAYARAKNLTTAVVEAGEALVRQAAAELHRTASPPIHLELGAVTVEGYGSFARRIEYPLAARGMLLLRGMHSERDAAAASNAAASDAVEASLFESGDGIRESGPNLDEVAATGGALRDDFGDDMLDGMGDGVGDGDEMMASNGAGKTTLAMAPLWAQQRH